MLPSNAAASMRVKFHTPESGTSDPSARMPFAEYSVTGGLRVERDVDERVLGCDDDLRVLLGGAAIARAAEHRSGVHVAVAAACAGIGVGAAARDVAQRGGHRHEQRQSGKSRPSGRDGRDMSPSVPDASVPTRL